MPYFQPKNGKNSLLPRFYGCGRAILLIVQKLIISLFRMKLLTSVDAQVKEADDDLNEINDQLVELNKTKETGDDTVGQIQRILKKQLENITWIDNKTGRFWGRYFMGKYWVLH